MKQKQAGLCRDRVLFWILFALPLIGLVDIAMVKSIHVLAAAIWLE